MIVSHDSPAAAVPTLKALLMCDLVASTQLVEQVGDAFAAEVSARHDRVTRDQRVVKFCFEVERLRGLQRDVTLFRLLKDALGDRPDMARILDWSFEQSPYFIESEYTAGGSLEEWVTEQGGVEQVPLAQRRLGGEHPQTIVVLTNLADVLTAGNRFREAEPLLVRAGAAAEKAHGSEHPHLGAILLNLAEVQAKQGRVREAETSFRRSLAIFERAFSMPHPWTAMGLGYLANLLCDTRRSAQAGSLYERAVSICDATLGAEHPQCAALRRDRARAAGDADDDGRAVEK